MDSEGRLTVEDGLVYFEFCEKWGETPDKVKLSSCSSCGCIVGHFRGRENSKRLGDLFWYLVGGLDQPFTSKKVMLKVAVINLRMLEAAHAMGRSFTPLYLNEGEPEGDDDGATA